MSEGYQRRPEERSGFAKWCVSVQPLALIVTSIGLIVTNCCWMAEMQISRRLRAEVAEKQSHMLQWSQHYQTLRAENAELTRQLDFFTCRVQLEPMPVPEQVGEGPTLVETEGETQ